MGGYGSGRRGWRTAVEDCKALSVFELKDTIARGPGYRGSLTWYRGKPENVTGSISYDLVGAGPYGVSFRLRYNLTDRLTNEKEHFDYAVELTQTRPNFGGARWWFVCPLVVNGRECGRRVAKLYLPPNGKYFGCRHCYNLTYASCQDSHKYDGLYARLGADIGRPAWFVKAALEKRRGRRYDRRLEQWFLGGPEGQAWTERIAREMQRHREEESEKTMHVDPNALYSLTELAEELKVSKRTLQRLVKSGRLPARKLGRRVLVRGADLLEGLPEVEAARARGGRRWPR